MNGHDQAFKHLLQTFFPEFLEAFVPQLRLDLDLKSIQFLDKELIRGKSGVQTTRVVDLVARVSFRGHPGFILVHIEHSGKRKKNTTERLFLYAARLMERYGLPVYPILLTSYDEPRTPESDRYVVEVRGLRVIDFRCRVVQLNRMDWREFARLKNPAATALMAKMRIAAEDRVRVKLQILRLLASMRGNRAKMD